MIVSTKQSLWSSPSNARNGVIAVFFIQLFATISFAVVYGSIVLYMKQKLGLSSRNADIITGVYFAYNFSLHLLAGYIGGRLFSYRSLIIVGLICQLIACLCLSMVTIPSLYLGLSFMLVGTGTMVTCINMLISQLFDAKDERRETAFFWNYSGMNLGFIMGFTLTGFLQLSQNYHALYLATSISNIITLLIISFNWATIKDKHTLFSKLPRAAQLRRNLGGLVLLAALLILLFVLLHHPDISSGIVIGIGILALIFIVKITFYTKQNSNYRGKLIVFVVLLLCAQVFWIIYQLAPMAFTLFAQYNVNRHILGITIAPSWIQNINSFTIIIGGPILAMVFNRMRKKNQFASPPFQFSIGLLIAGLGLLLLPLGIHLATTLGYVAFIWIFICYVMEAIAELCLSPVAYSMVGLLVPYKYQSLMMGMVLLNTGVAAIFAAKLSNYAIGLKASTNPLISNPHFSHAFLQLGSLALIVGVLLLIASPALNRLILKKS